MNQTQNTGVQAASSAVGSNPWSQWNWQGPVEAVANDETAMQAFLLELTQALWIVNSGGQVGLAAGGDLIHAGSVGSTSTPILGFVPAIPLENLGDPAFRSTYAVRAAYYAGAMAGGIASEDLIIALEGMLSYTFTDYLDDVSTIYITYPELLEKAGPLTAALANRQGEYLGTEPVIVPTGAARANPDTRDLFGVITVRVGVPIAIGVQKFKVRRHNNKTIPNPKF